MPLNCTAVLQPLDQGIIRAVKARYKSRLLTWILLNLNTVNETAVNIKQAIDMILGSWWSVKVSTIVKCWEKTGLIPAAELGSPTENETHETDDTVEPFWKRVAAAIGVPPSVSFDDFVTADYC